MTRRRSRCRRRARGHCACSRRRLDRTLRASPSSSSSDSDSDADDADQHEMHKLAADLAGVSTDDAASLFASAKPSSSRATAGVGDMDADREAHAPQFDKRVRAPVAGRGGVCGARARGGRADRTGVWEPVQRRTAHRDAVCAHRDGGAAVRSRAARKAGQRAEAVAARVVSDTRRVGEQRVPQLRRERQLRLDSSRTTLVQEIRPGTSLAVDPDGRGWAAMAGAFVFPLLNRYLAYQALSSRGSALRTRLARTVVRYARRTDLAGATFGPETAAALSALAIFLHAHLELDSAASLLNDRTSVHMLKTLLPRVQMLFTQLNAHTGGTPAKVAARAATVLLQMDQLDQAQTQTIQDALGFIPA
ncbi:hypothetical protein L1887_62390 [Cichorium endivia]|nr:hypothetical protein L1887_62390 [Cichorium endivia]